MVQGAKLVKNPDDLTFRFGSDVHGKPIPMCSNQIGVGKCPDQLAAVAVYEKKKPPIRRDGSFFLDGKKITGIPYYGDPLRGGVRVYSDNRLVTTIKRKKLTDKTLLASKDGDVSTWKLFPVLAAQGVATAKVKEAWLIFDDKRTQKISGKDLSSATFVASSQGRGEILIGPKKLRAQAIALHSKPVNKNDIPTYTKRELELFVNQ